MKQHFIDKSVLALVKHLSVPIYKEWDEATTQIEYEYRIHLPEGVVVDAVRAFIESYSYVPKEMSDSLWQNVMIAIRDLDEYEFNRIQAAKAFYNRKHGVPNDVPKKFQEEKTS